MDSETAQVRRRIGGETWVSTAPEIPATDLVVMQPSPTPTRTSNRKRRKKRARSRWFWLVPITGALAIIAGGVLGLTLSQTDEVISTVQQVSTPAPQVADQTANRDGSSSEPSADDGDGTTSESETGGSADQAGVVSSTPVGGGTSNGVDDQTQAVIAAPTVTNGSTDTVSASIVVVDGETEAEAQMAAGMTFDTAPAVTAIAEASVDEDEDKSSDDGGVLGGLRSTGGDLVDLADGAAVAAGVSTSNLEPMTVLMMGVDARPGSPIDIGVRPDALMVLRIDPGAGTCKGLAVPRDSWVRAPRLRQDQDQPRPDARRDSV